MGQSLVPCSPAAGHIYISRAGDGDGWSVEGRGKEKIRVDLMDGVGLLWGLVRLKLKRWGLTATGGRGTENKETVHRSRGWCGSLPQSKKKQQCARTHYLVLPHAAAIPTEDGKKSQFFTHKQFC